MNLLADLDPKSPWNEASGTPFLFIKIFAFLVIGLLLLYGLLQIKQPQLKRLVLVGFTFVSGLYYVLLWLYPAPIAAAKDDRPRDAFEGFGFWLKDAQPTVAAISNIITAMLIGLGIYSLLRIHVGRLVKAQKDWGYSVVLLVCMVLMAFFGYWDFMDRLTPAGQAMATGYTSGTWHFQQYAKDLLFDGIFQQMEAGMFSMIAFYILSAAYRAFRARSIEATILLATALLVILSNMGAISAVLDSAIKTLPGGDTGFLANLKLSAISGWLKDAIQTPSIRGIDFGVGIGLLAMGLRLWLSMDSATGEA